MKVLGAALWLALVVVGMPGAQAAAPIPPGGTLLELSMPASVEDGGAVDVDARWSYPDAAGDPEPPSGRVALELRRTGTSSWAKYETIDIERGTGTVTITPRDDGEFRLRFSGDSDIGAVVSAAQAFDNQPTSEASVRFGEYNLPGADKLPKAATRAARAADQIDDADLDVVVMNELVGPGANRVVNKPSSFAATVLDELGSKWKLITPMTSANENYIAYRADRMGVIQQYPDRIIPGVGTKGSGRHITSALLKDLDSNRPVLVAVTHLINDNRAGARKQSATVAAEVQARSAGYPIIAAGDMNTSEQLSALTSIKLKDARRTALATRASTYSTHTRYSATTPRSDPDWIIDQIYVPSAWVVQKWTTALDTKDLKFIQPRASDHALVWILLESTS